MIRLFFATDFHGSQTVWNKFLKTPEFLGVNMLIGGGDVTGKMIVPLIEQANGTHSYYLHGRVQEVRGEQEMAAAEAKIRSGGYYPYRTSPEEVEVLERVEAARTKLFERLMKERVEGWLSQAADRVARHIPIFVMPGNDDSWAVQEAFDGNERVVNAEGKVVSLGEGFEMASFAWVNPTPWNSPRETDEGRLETMLEELFSQVKDPSRLVANLHAPPFDSNLDMAPALDDKLRPKVGLSGVKQVPVGSKAVRKVIEKYQPILGLHGHIHESSGKRKIGRTVCVNPGSEYGEGVLRGFVIELDQKGVKDVRMVYK